MNKVYCFFALLACMLMSFSASAADKIDLESLFLRPLGITADINTLTAEQFEAQLKGRVEYKRDTMFDDVTFSFPTYKIEVAGVALSPMVSFGDMARGVNYGPADRNIDNAAAAAAIKQAIEASGYKLDEKAQRLFDEINEDENREMKNYAFKGGSVALSLEGSRRKRLSLSYVF